MGTPGQDMTTRIRGLYVIIDPDACNRHSPVETARLALEGGASVIQWRDKRREKGEQLPEASAIGALCDAQGATFIVNDHADLAVAAHADGVHLGPHDLGLDSVRTIVGDRLLIGVSTNTVDEARRAEAVGADYIAVGSVFPTESKPDTRPASLARLHEIKSAVRLPVVAIGGIGATNIGDVVAAGADAAAVISAVCGAHDTRKAAARLAQAFTATEVPRTSRERIHAIVHAYVDAVNRRDRAGFLALFARDGIREDPPDARTYIGRDEISRWWDEIRMDDRPFQLRVRNIVVVRQEAALFWTIAHEHDDGKAAVASGVEIISVEDSGEIASAHSYWTRAALASSRPRIVAEQLTDAINARDRAAYLALWAPDGMRQDPVPGPPHIGLDALGIAFDELVATYAHADCTMGIDAICLSGNEAALAWTAVSRTGDKSRLVSGVEVLELDDAGSIAALHSYWEPDNLPEYE